MHFAVQFSETVSALQAFYFEFGLKMPELVNALNHISL